jgi:ABC-type sugar transport system substrate-binding protein
MRDIELGWPESDEDRERLTADLLQAVGEVVEPHNITTLLTIDGDPVAGIAPASQIVQEHPDTVTIPRGDFSMLLAAAAALTGSGPVPEMLPPLVGEVLARYKVRLEVTP